ncbi:hypothetical protein YC2023_094224 [Brassica napus]
MRSEISDPENLLRGSGLKINEEGSRSGNKKGGNDVTGSEGQEKGSVNEEEILSIEEEIVVEKANEEVRKEDTIKVSEDGEEGKNKTIGGKSGMKETKEDNKNDQIGKSIAGIQHWPDLANSITQSLPRR